MVHCHKAVLLLAPLKKRKFHDPEEVKLRLVNQPKLLPKLHAQRAEHAVNDVFLIRSKQKQITFFALHCLHQLRKLLLRHKLRKGRLVSAVLLHT